jgi:flagellar protein FlgJ
MINSMQQDISVLTAQQSYTDLASLQKIKTTGKEDQDLALRQVAQQFESMFVQMMLKSMRSANDVFGKDNPLNSFEMKHHQEMYDSQLSLSLSSSNKLGLADAFYRQMKTNYLPPEVKLDNIEKEVPGIIERESTMIDSAMYQSILNKMPVHEETLGNKNTTSSLSLPISSEKIVRDDIKLKNIDSPEDFINMLVPYAKKAASALGVDYQVLIAQAALETGWGKHIIKDGYGKQSFNLFNIKADSRWEGKAVNVPTIEYINGVAKKEVASFRRYDSISESFNDYQKFLAQPRYEKALASTNSTDFITGLQSAGYATDPRYADKIQRIIDTAIPIKEVRD